MNKYLKDLQNCLREVREVVLEAKVCSEDGDGEGCVTLLDDLYDRVIPALLPTLNPLAEPTAKEKAQVVLKSPYAVEIVKALIENNDYLVTCINSDPYADDVEDVWAVGMTLKAVRDVYEVATAVDSEVARPHALSEVRLANVQEEAK